jgi:hypothetical protein
LKTYFDDWGGRCYLFVDELGKNYDYRKDSRKTIKHLQLNINQFKKMGGKYIFSAVPILNSRDNNLVLMKTFKNKDSVWKIYLYSVKKD